MAAVSCLLLHQQSFALLILPLLVCHHKHTAQSSSLSTQRKRLFDVGIGLLASLVIALTPLEDDATRIEYYATTADLPNEFSFVRSSLGFCDIAPGSGVEPPYGELINIDDTARFAEGRLFDSSYKHARPLTMRIGVGKGIGSGNSWGDGVPPMLVGGKRKLQIPLELAYGPEPAGCFSGDCNTPANATLIYDINFVSIYSRNRNGRQSKFNFF